MEIRTIEYGSKDYDAQLYLRNEVLRKPIGRSVWDDDRSGEDRDIHVCAFEEGKLIGTMTLTPEGNGSFRMRQVAVDPTLQRGGVGRQLAAFTEKVLLEKGGSRITVHARTSALGFYEKCGFVATGEEFLELGLPHYPMEKVLKP